MAKSILNHPPYQWDNPSTWPYDDEERQIRNILLPLYDLTPPRYVFVEIKMTQLLGFVESRFPHLVNVTIITKPAENRICVYVVTSTGRGAECDGRWSWML